jgi:protein translocation Sec62 family protein
VKAIIWHNLEDNRFANVTVTAVKRAIRAIESPAYAKAAAKKNSLLPPVTDRASAENIFKLLPLSLLALRVSKVDPHEGHNHAKPKNRVKGLWTVKIEQHQETDPMMHYVWLYEGPQWKQKALAAAVVVGIFAVVLFPLWPVMLRQGVWYLSVGMMGLLGLFFAMSIFRLILFCITVFAVPPGLWLFPNLFEDVGFFDSFKPLWGWQEVSPRDLSHIAIIHTNYQLAEQEEERQEVQDCCTREDIRRHYPLGNHNLCGARIRAQFDPCEAGSDCTSGRGGRVMVFSAFFSAHFFHAARRATKAFSIHLRSGGLVDHPN